MSYFWNDSDVANRIYDYFINRRQIELHRDVIDIKKWHSIRAYMQSISNMDYIILLISDSYLKSANGMYDAKLIDGELKMYATMSLMNSQKAMTINEVVTDIWKNYIQIYLEE